jgi:haloalkane dehalogenase
MTHILKLGALIASAMIAISPVLAKDNAPRFPTPVVAKDVTIPRHEVAVLGSTMSYLEEGTGEAVVFLHGNPTAAYLWRNVIPHISATHRAIAPDLIGMGHSGKPEIDYTFADHSAYLDAFIAEIGLTEFTLVGHDWGAALAWDFARRNPEMVVRLAFMEGLLPPAFPQPSYEAMGDEMGGLFRALQDQEQGYQMIMEGNMFIEGILPQMVVRPLGDKAKAEYGAPYGTVESRLPTWMWPREVPIGGNPEANVALMENILGFMGETDMPVLLAYAEPGVLVPPQAVPFYTGLIVDLETAFVGQGLHFIQEDQPDAIGRAISDWLRRR